MATKSIVWNTGSGNISINYTGKGNGTIEITSDNNNLYEARSQQITVKTTDGSDIQRTITIQQAAKIRIDISTAVVTAASQTYSGSEKTPAPTVTLNGETIPSSGYDVVYSNNTNAGTATITVTGKNDYTGTATGTFTIAKANPVYVAPTANNRTYDTSSAALLVAGSNTTPGSFTYSTSQSGTYSTTIPSQTNAGTYTTWWKFTPTDTTNYNSIGATSVSATISAKTVSSPTITLSQSTYTYSGSACTPTATVKDGSTTISSSEYTVSYSNNTNAGTATVTITDKSGGNYTVSGSTTFTINKANPTYTAPTAITGLTYSGSSQYLVNAGSTSHGTIQYSSNGTSWSTTRPSSTNAGLYTTYWRLVGDSNHNDVASTSLSTTIAKASRTLSFADSYVVLNTSSNVTKTATPSAGSGDGTITYSISSTTYATINSSSGKVTSKTSDGSAVVTATIAEGTNYLSATASYNLYVFATTHDYSYNGSYRSVTLPPGTYQFQCWGAQGGSNGTNSTYGITAKAGGKGGYSVGQLTVSQATGIRVYVGGQGSSSSGGYNGGGSTTGTSQYNASNEFGYSKMGGGGGATDIRLSDGSLYSRMIVAGGGSGGAMGYKAVTTSTTTTITDNSFTSASKESIASGNTRYYILQYSTGGYKNSTTYTVSGIPSGFEFDVEAWTTSGQMWGSYDGGWARYNVTSFTTPSNASGLYFNMYLVSQAGDSAPATVSMSLTVTHTETTSSTTTSTNGHKGYAGGGERSEAVDSAYVATQTTAGTNASFGQGANQTTTNYRYCGGAGGGGWYGGSGNERSDTSLYCTLNSGGGSGWVNTAASAGNRPSGYNGIQLDSGETKAGNTSFVAPGGGNETGHAGNGYARITRLS